MFLNSLKFILTLVTLSLSANAQNSTPLTPRVHQRVPNNFRAIGVDPAGNSCLVIFDIYSRSSSQIREASISKGIVAPEMEVSIYSEGLEKKSFLASWQTRGGRGGCPVVKLDTIRKFHFYQRTGVGAPCFANPGRLSWSSELEMQVVDSPSGQTQDALKIVLNRITGLESTCTLENAHKFIRF